MEHEIKAYSMRRFYTIVGSEGPVRGTWQVMKDARRGHDDEYLVNPIDVLIWDAEAQFGTAYYSGDFTARVKGGEVDLDPAHVFPPNKRYTLTGVLADVKATVLAVVAAAVFEPDPELSSSQGEGDGE